VAAVISILGVISLVILVICLIILVLHFRVLGKRAAMDDALSTLDELLHDRMELLVDYADSLEPDRTESEEIYTLYELLVTAETRQILKFWAKMQKFVTGNDALQKETEENTAKVTETVIKYNASTEAYNKCISKHPGKLVAYVLSFKPQKQLNFTP